MDKIIDQKANNTVEVNAPSLEKPSFLEILLQNINVEIGAERRMTSPETNAEHYDRAVDCEASQREHLNADHVTKNRDNCAHHRIKQENDRTMHLNIADEKVQ